MAQENLHKELNNILGKDGNVTAESLAQLPYLKACVKESARQVNLSSANLIVTIARRRPEELKLKF